MDRRIRQHNLHASTLQKYKPILKQHIHVYPSTKYTFIRAWTKTWPPSIHWHFLRVQRTNPDQFSHIFFTYWVSQIDWLRIAHLQNWPVHISAPYIRLRHSVYTKKMKTCLTMYQIKLIRPYIQIRYIRQHTDKWCLWSVCCLANTRAVVKSSSRLTENCQVANRVWVTVLHLKCELLFYIFKSSPGRVFKETRVESESIDSSLHHWMVHFYDFKITSKPLRYHYITSVIIVSQLSQYLNYHSISRK